jgi:predicted nucleic acid-binding protein
VTFVVDTSVLVPALVDDGAQGAAARAALDVDGRRVIAPALLDSEVAHSLRGLVRGGKLPEPVAATAIDILADMPIHRMDAVPLLRRIWELRDNVSAYDATYVALAEVFGATLLTADRRLTEATGPRCKFELVDCADRR